MPTIEDVFGDALQADPELAIHPPQIPVRRRTGPMPRLQFVIEFVGPRSVSASTAVALLHPQWQAALGEPRAFAMSGADVEWQTLTQTTSGSYDSIALAWDLITTKGTLTKQTAQHLLQVAEQFAEHLQRKAMAMPLPADVPKACSLIRQVESNFDAGISLLVLSESGRMSEYESWVWLAKLGLEPNLAEGTFDWRVPSSELPLFQVSPLNDSEAFSLEAAARGDQMTGLLFGFNLPRSPEPMAAFEGMLHASSVLATKMGGRVYDEANRPMTDRSANLIRGQIGAASQAMTKLGFPPGSPECLILFSGDA